jgi:hypothetical protein
MASPAPQRDLWNRKRWIALAALWLVVSYLLLGGPSQYACRRGWLSGDDVRIVYLPGWTRILDVPMLGPMNLSYCDWWVALADRHRFPSR